MVTKTNLKPYNIELAKKMLETTTDFTHIKKITGLSIRAMVQLGLIEYYHPFTKTVPNPKATKISDAFIQEVDTSITWLRKAKKHV